MNYDPVGITIHNVVGDIVTVNGERVRIVKRTNYAVAVEPYRWYHQVEDFLLEKFGKYLP